MMAMTLVRKDTRTRPMSFEIGPQEECDEVPDSTPLLHFVPTELRPYLVEVNPSLVPWRNKTSLVVHLAEDDDEKLCVVDSWERNM